MSTDLFGKPLGKAPAFELSTRQKRQATLLHHWTSKAYLEGLQTLIDALMTGADLNLSLARAQGRDELIANAQWGVRDTAANWGSLGWPALQDFKQSTLRLLGWRSGELYCGTGLTQCDRMLSELSPYWMTPDEKAWFDSQWKVVNDFAYRLDQAVGTGTRRPLNDRGMADQWTQLAALFPKLPRFKVNTDREFASGEMPQKTGVYVPVDDPNGTLQFAWTGSEEGALGECVTLSDVGLEIQRQVGADRMWVDPAAMVAVVGPMYERGQLKERGGFPPGCELDTDCVNSVITREVFVRRSCKWYFVEKLDGEFEASGVVETQSEVDPVQGRLRCEAGRPCPRAGIWFSPAAAEPRRFKQGEVMPVMTSDWGQTIWYLDKAGD